MKAVPYSDLKSYYVDRPDRRAVDMRSAGVPECIVLGRSVYRHAYPPLPEHRHFEVAELAYVETGHQPYDINGQHFTLLGGEGTVIPPDMPHSSDGHPSYPGKRIWLQLQLPQNPDIPWLGLSPAEAQPLLEMLQGSTHLFCSKWPADFSQRINALFCLFDRPASPVRTAAIRTSLLAILLDLLDLTVTTPSKPNQDRIRKATDWVEKELNNPITLEQLSAIAGLSLSNFKRVFKEVAGITPHAYILRRRIDHAQELLRKRGGSVTEIAFACGFSSSQYFATAFKRITGMTPNDVLQNRIVSLPSDADGQ
ncbi:MAG: AraC family transcriptional regulator [Kiritimatiellae bacterium]|jgi:AraC-like DNA-binding protein|nr:AraC family transcriptional regulator [Kiritimatiellia bacterium]